MSKIVNETHQQIRQAILDAMGKAVSAGTLPAEPVCDFKIEVPGDTKNGDFSSNVAMMSTKTFRMNPRKIGEAIIIAARTRPKFTGGERAVYNDELR